MNIVMVAVNKLNPGQLPIITFDQLFCALAKEVYWLFLDLYGEKKIVIFGGLCIEMAILKFIGHWLKISG